MNTARIIISEKSDGVDEVGCKDARDLSLGIEEDKMAKRYTPMNSILDGNLETVPLIVFQDYQEQMRDYLKTVKLNNVAKYDKEFYRISKSYFKHNIGKIVLNDLILGFPLFGRDNTYIDPEKIENFQNQAKKAEQIDPKLSRRYKIINKLTNLISALAAKWKLFNPHKYSYRFNFRTQCSRFLNLSKMNSACFSIDTLWFCSSINKGFIEEILTPSLQQYGQILENQANLVFEKMLVPKIGNPEDLKHSKNCICFKKKVANSAESTKTYICLEIPGLLNRILCKSKLNYSVSLFKLIDDFEYCYRNFERELIGRFMTLAT